MANILDVHHAPKVTIHRVNNLNSRIVNHHFISHPPASACVCACAYFLSPFLFLTHQTYAALAVDCKGNVIHFAMQKTKRSSIDSADECISFALSRISLAEGLASSNPPLLLHIAGAAKKRRTAVIKR